MSEVAGRLSVQEGAFYLGRAHGGRGILLSGVPGVPPGNVVILGAGTAGLNAVKAAAGLGADVSILDVNLDRLRLVDDLFRGQVVTLISNSFNIDQVVRRADLLVGAVLVAGARAPVVVSKEMVAQMKDGSVIVDIAVDQGGCIATIHPTTLLDPVYVVSGVVHYGVANMPASSRAPRRSRSRTPPCPTRSSWRIAGGRPPCAATRRWPGASTSGAGRSCTRRSPRRSARGPRRSR